MAKRTYINADEELIIQGKLILEGNIEQRQFVHNVEFTQQDFAGDILVVNSDGVDGSGTATDGQLRLVSGSSYGSLIYSQSANVITVNANVSAPYFIGAISSADGLTSAVNIAITTDATGTGSFQNGGDTATIPVTLATVNTDTGTWGSETTIPTFTVNGKGLITSASHNLANISSSQVYNLESTVEGFFSAVDNGGDGSFSYSNGVYTYTGPNAAEVQAHFSAGTNTTYSAGTFDITDSTIRSKVSATDSGGDGSFTYNSTTGVFTYTGPSASEVRAHLSASNGVDYNSSTGAFQAVESEIQHDSLDGFVADEHVAHSSVTLTAGAGLTGGGTIASSRTFNVGESTGITVNADSIQTNDSEIVHDNLSGFVANEHIDHSSVTLTAGAGLTGGGDITTNRTFNIGEGTGITVSANEIATDDSEINHDNLQNYVALEHVDHSSVTLTAGDGLSGGGTIQSSRSFAVDSTVVRTNTAGTQSISKDTTFTGTVDLSGATVPGFTIDGELSVTGNVNSLNYVDLQVQNSEIILNSNVATAQNAVIKNERGSSGNDTYIKWNEGSSRWQFSNNGSTDNNMLLFSDFSATDAGGDGSFSYSNGVYTYTGPSSAEVQAHFTAGTNTTYGAGTFDITDSTIRSKVNATDAGGDGSFTYNSTTGAFTYTGPSLAEVQTRIDNSAANVQAHFSAGTNTTYSAGVFDITNSTIRSKFSVTDNGGDGSLSYSNGVFTYTGPSQAEVLAHISGGTGIAVSGSGVISTTDSEIVHDNLSGFVGNEHIDHSGVTLTAGTGLTGGGDITSDRTFNVIGGDGITANANDIAVDSTVVRTSGTQTIAGTKTFSDTLLLPNSSTNTDRAIYTDNANQKAYVYLNGDPIEITPAVDAGTVEDVGAGDINLYAGSRTVANVTHHGIKSVSDSTYSTISESANVITIDADISAIRGAFSAVDNAGDGTFSYNSSTGAFSYSGVSQSQIRGEFSASGSELSYDNSTGVFTSTADNYAHWTLQTDSGSGSSENVTSTEKVTIQGGTNISVTNSGNVITIANDNAADITAVTAGNGLTGGGNSGAVSLALSDSHVRGLLSASGDISYNSTTGVISFSQASAPVTSVNSQTGAVVLTTTNIAEGTNLYHTTARARAAISATGDISYNSSTGVISFTNDAGDIESVGAGAGLTGGGTSGAVTLNVGAGTGISVAADSIAVNMSAFSTTNLSEGTNLYYTDARADARVSNALGGDVTIGGNLTVSGTQTIINTETLTVDDNIIVLNNNETGTPSQNAGIEVERGTSTNVKFQFKESTDRWQFTNDGSTYFNLPTSTADVAENTNLYHTTARARSAISVTDAGGLGSASYNSGTGVITYTGPSNADIRGLFSASGDISYNGTTGEFSFTDSDTVGTVTNVTVGTGLDVSNGTTTPSITLDLSEFTDMTAAVDGTQDELILLDNGAERRKLISEITLSDFNNDLGNYGGWSTTTGTVTSVSGGAGLTGSVTTSGSLAVGQGSYIIVNANDIAVDATSANTASKVVARDGSGNFSAGVITATATSARYADLAEMYSADASYDPGTVLVIGGDAEVTVTDEPGSYQAVGVVSTDPAYLMNKDANGVAVALRGRVPCKVLGNVNKGDVLITSNLPGHAMVAADPKSLSPLQIIGRALETKTEAAPGVIEILV